MMIGYALWDHTGKQPEPTRIRDHADGIADGNLSPDPMAEARVTPGSDEGFIMFDLQGKIRSTFE